jgi:hypothetical protein
MNHSAHSVPSTALKALSLAVATLLMQSHALATPSPEELNSVKLYGDVTIAQDSVNNWGPWEQFEAPAAAPGALSLPRTTVDFFRTLPKVTEREAGINQDLVGFGGFTNLTLFKGEGGEGGGGGMESDGPHSVSLTGKAFDIPEVGSLAAQALQLQTTTLSTGTHPMPDSGKMRLNGTDYSSVDGQGHQANLQLIPSDLSSEVVAAKDVQASFYTRYVITKYMAGDEIDPNVVERGALEIGVIGYQTSLRDMDSLRSGGFQATYTGQSLSAAGGSSNMSMLVDFEKSTVRGHFDQAGGYDFIAPIVGASFNSTRVTDGESTLQNSFVNGRFTGIRAAGAIGVSDITKDGVRDVAAFLAVQQSLSNRIQEASVGKVK